MRRTAITQKGFTSLETILVIVVLVLVGGTGYFVYHVNRKTSTLLNTSSVNGGKGGKSGPNTGPAKTEIFLIPEWKVAAEIPTPPESSALIQYKIIQQGGQTWAQFSTQELKDADPSCAVEQNASAGIISRAKASDHAYLNDGTDTGRTIQQDIDSGALKSYKKIGDYYYWYQHPQGACGNSTKVPQLQKAAIQAVEMIAARLTAN